MPRSDVNAPRARRWSGPWSDDPVRDAEVAARLEALQTRLQSASASAVDRGLAAGEATRRGRIQTLRLRVGHALVSLGGFVEGQADCADLTSPRTV